MLGEGSADTFLETKIIRKHNGDLEHRLKNDNENGTKKIWRYQHWHSNSPVTQKRATLTACLRKVHQQASNNEQLLKSALGKIEELWQLRYPTSILQKACNLLGASTGNRTWITVRDTLKTPTVQRPVGGHCSPRIPDGMTLPAFNAS